MWAQKYCCQKTLASGSSFYYSFYLLSPKKKRAMFALYAFCREVDDIVDEITDKNLAWQKIKIWQAEIKNLHLGKSQNPIAQELLIVTQEFNINPLDLQKIINGMVMDLEDKRYNTWAELYEYCDCVAGVVGRISARIFGFNPNNENKIMSYSTSLGLALQLINVLRDIKNDAGRGRVYIPQEFLGQILKFQGINIGEQIKILAKNLEENDYRIIKNKFAELINMAFINADNNIPEEEVKSQRAGIVMGRIYREVYKKIMKQETQVEVRVSTMAKIKIIIGVILFKQKIT